MKPEKNRKILDAAQVEFKNRGLEAASMEKIAKEAGVSKRTLYNYYPEKPLLYNAMLEDISKALELTSEIPYDSNHSVDQLIETFIDTKIKLVTDNNFKKLAELILVERITETELDSSFTSIAKMAQDRLRVWIEKCIKDKKFTTGHKVENLVLFLHSTVDGIMLFSTVGGLNKSHSDEEIAEYRSMLKKSLIAVVTGN